ncbi:MAG: hypothetical protein HN737_04805 [Desulfobacterales bacterium]|jgi:hypothetical protein|nr:hypothetical protein [Desulfobacteraceae bacterium]MBT4362896.1 hypothetical protein [Desulfobacteraceae bacterium]MBT7086031.1 hypothetical protein [Desulfobacterales bacterium]MBT7696713.1 hypothetical protein [Desulfobacterales bacterium]
MKNIDKVIKLLKSLGGKKPDLDNTDYSKWKQTEEEYLKEQEKWLKEVKKKKDSNENPQNEKNPSNRI